MEFGLHGSKLIETYVYTNENADSEDDESTFAETRSSISTLGVFKKALTNYDLPLEYHWDAFVKRRYSHYRARSEHDLSVVDNVRKRRGSKFSKLQPNILKETFMGRQTFDYLREMSIKKLKHETFKMLNIIHELQKCTENYTTLDIPHKVFSWADEDFISRRKMENVVWADVLIREIDHDCLNKLKFKLDIEELIKYVETIFDSLLGDDQKKHSATINKIQSLYEYMNKINDLSEQFEANKKSFFDVVNASLGLRFFKLDEKAVQFQKKLQDQLMNMDVFDPIELRYHLSYINSKVLYHEFKGNEPVKKLNNQIMQYNKMLETEQYCSQCTLNAIYNDSENYKNKIEEMTNIYDSEFDKIENRISATSLKLEKLQNQRKYLTEEIERFYEQYELLKQRDIREKLHDERLKKERLEKIAAKKAAAAAKKAAKRTSKLSEKRAVK